MEKQTTLDKTELPVSDCRHWSMYAREDPEDESLSIVYCLDCDYTVKVAKSRPLVDDVQKSTLEDI